MSEEDKKKLYIYVLVAALLGGGGSTGLQLVTSDLRSDSFTGTQGQRHSDRIGENTRVNNKQRVILESVSARLSYIERDYVTRDKCADTRKKLDVIINHDERMTADIRTIFTLINKLPPQELMSRVTNLELWKAHFQKEHEYIMDLLRGGK